MKRNLLSLLTLVLLAAAGCTNVTPIGTVNGIALTRVTTRGFFSPSTTTLLAHDPTSPGSFPAVIANGTGPGVLPAVATAGGVVGGAALLRPASNNTSSTAAGGSSSAYAAGGSSSSSSHALSSSSAVNTPNFIHSSSGECHNTPRHENHGDE